ncbi:hypothetical protein RchiOBHm_Chr1g0349041 [Rosa chinensis]|uniref:Uncharacterized protein n=1 Tax=Rosa chinensis TaxID=74649 RepID=A0A2P6SFP9_ROSCH|nr:hypothetical protein RchiOBHm_Chr1g0349041 [Rosa chinensis]
MQIWKPGCKYCIMHVVIVYLMFIFLVLLAFFTLDLFMFSSLHTTFPQHLSMTINIIASLDYN